MKIKLISDLHVEFWNSYKVPEAMLVPNSDVVVLAGDIAVKYSGIIEVLRQFAKAYKSVIYVPGNHEFYGSDIHFLDKLEDDLHIRGIWNVHFLNPGCVSIAGVHFIGAPLWTNFREDFLAQHMAKSMIADFQKIKGFSPAKAKELHYKHLEHIRFFYNELKGPKVIVTHFLPSVECISERFRGEGLLNNYFANDLGKEIEDMKNVPYWMFGHTHDSVDFMQGDVRMLCNPYGYEFYETNKDFKEMIVEIK